MMVNDWDHEPGRQALGGVWAGKHNNGSLYYTLWSRTCWIMWTPTAGVNFSGNLTTSSMTAGVFP